MVRHSLCALLVAGPAWVARGSDVTESYTEFKFAAAGEPEFVEKVTEGVDTPYTLKKQTFYSQGFPLHPGQMLFTDPSRTKIPMPHGQYAITAFGGDIINDDGHGQMVPTPLNEAYDHHWIVADMTHRNVLCPHAPNYVFGVGSESRNSPVNLPKGFGYVVKGWDAWVPWGANIHLLRTDSGDALQGDDPWLAVKECNECYYAAGKGAGCSPSKNGTFQCCGDSCYSGVCTCPVKRGVSMTPKTYYLRYTVTYTNDINAVAPVGIGMYAVPNCQAFYDVQRNDQQPYHLASSTFYAGGDGILLHGRGHQHVGAVNISFFHNDKFICSSHPTYGKTPGKPGDEKGYLVDMSECFNKDMGMTVSFRRGDKVRIDSWYYVGSNDPRIAPLPGGTHLNVMGYMYIAYSLQGSTLEIDHPTFGPAPTKGCEVQFHHVCGKLLGFPQQCKECTTGNLAKLHEGGCTQDMVESICEFRSPRGGLLGVLV